MNRKLMTSGWFFLDEISKDIVKTHDHHKWAFIILNSWPIQYHKESQVAPARLFRTTPFPYQSCSSSMVCGGLSWSAPAASVLCCWTKSEGASSLAPRTSCCRCHWTTSPNKSTRLVRAGEQETAAACLIPDYNQINWINAFSKGRLQQLSPLKPHIRRKETETTLLK